MLVIFIKEEDWETEEMTYEVGSLAFFRSNGIKKRFTCKYTDERYRETEKAQISLEKAVGIIYNEDICLGVIRMRYK